jgi:hypothetical protein
MPKKSRISTAFIVTQMSHKMPTPHKCQMPDPTQICHTNADPLPKLSYLCDKYDNLPYFLLSFVWSKLKISRSDLIIYY